MSNCGKEYKTYIIKGGPGTGKSSFMKSVAAYAENSDVARLAIEAGNDLIITTDYRTQIPKILEAIEAGSLSMETINNACRRVLTWKQSLGLLE